jgi:uncharacterized membrane protein
MAFCAACGAPVEGRFCAKCGTPVGTPEPAPTATGLPENVAATLCYVLGLFTGVLFLVLSPYNGSKFVRFHAFQSIFLHVTVIALWFVDTAIVMMLPWGLSVIASLLGFALAIAIMGIWVLLLIRAYQGERFKLPLIGDLAEKQA